MELENYFYRHLFITIKSSCQKCSIIFITYDDKIIMIRFVFFNHLANKKTCAKTIKSHLFLELL